MIPESIFFSQILRLERARFCSSSSSCCNPLHFPLSLRVQHPMITSLSSLSLSLSLPATDHLEKARDKARSPARGTDGMKGEEARERGEGEGGEERERGRCECGLSIMKPEHGCPSYSGRRRQWAVWHYLHRHHCERLAQLVQGARRSAHLGDACTTAGAIPRTKATTTEDYVWNYKPYRLTASILVKFIFICSLVRLCKLA